MTTPGEWGIEAVDLDAYFARIGHRAEPPSAPALRDLMRAHVQSIPFENVDVVLGQHQGISLDVVTAKLVGRRRGGYCYEQSGLFAAVLERLGYTVHRLAARVQPRRPGPATHMTVVVDVDGRSFLADVGFGAGIFAPIPLVDGQETDQAGWPHRIRHHDGRWTLQKGDEDLLEFRLDEMHPIDYEVYHHYTSTHPKSPFTGRLVIMTLEPGVSRKLLGRELTVEKPGGSGETTTIGPGELDATLKDLGIELTPDELSRLKTVY
ncbi:arylamine N-acetyltransferase family protein [Amycolatopsis australiensis]|uniref:N-hydroxyarylamine O-acetyltransferase n=1 Tax=Amycolatopsis australiensis TaxID=546364 RepID=A0A1K1PP38_9PSEU|nr:arylamine N-acetyltransferase [Amycolatopsis australiensis]SFW49227.1 N-hydroxyarylamine O-acetyltransferase [Amycolatopsis australiensis]